MTTKIKRECRDCKFCSGGHDKRACNHRLVNQGKPAKDVTKNEANDCKYYYDEAMSLIMRTLL